MSLGSYLVGVALFGLVIAAAIAAALSIATRVPELRGAPRFVAVALIATAALIAIHLIPAALGILTRGTVALVAAATLAGAIALRRPAAPPLKGSDPLTRG